VLCVSVEVFESHVGFLLPQHPAAICARVPEAAVTAMACFILSTLALRCGLLLCGGARESDSALHIKGVHKVLQLHGCCRNPHANLRSCCLLVCSAVQLSRCISSFACRRTDATRSEMASWAYMNSNLSTAMMTPTVIAPYMERMCLPGYTGPLCGACEAEYGHAGSSCVECLPRSANTLLYFLVCCFMFIIPVVQMVLHSKNVDKNTRLVEQASKLAAAGVMPFAGHPSFQNRTSNTSGGASFQPNLPPLQERPSQSPKAAAAAAATTVFPSPDKSVGAVELASMQARELPGRAELDTNLRADQSTSSIQSWDMVSPFSEPSAVAGAIAVSTDNSGTSIPPLPLPDVHQSLTLGPAGSGGQKSSSLFQRLFDVSSLDHDDTHIAWGVTQASGTHRRVLQHNVSSMSRRGPSGTSVTSQGSMISGAASPMPETVGGQPAGAAAAAGEGASSGLQPAAGGPGALPPGVLVVAPTRRTVHRRTYKFWHSDILSVNAVYAVDKEQGAQP